LSTANAPHDLRSLDGARFFAAVFVALGHSVASLLTFSPPLQLLETVLYSLVDIGMSLFFVLSGFVIHYTYSTVIRRSRQEVARFYVARAARLAPLYYLCILASLAIAWSAKDFPAAFYYLSLSQSWLFILHDNQALLAQLRTMSVTWSISTEWFLYCVYPLLALVLHRCGHRVFIVLIMACMTSMSLVYAYHEAVTGFAAAMWGPGANANNQFFSWILKYSPLGRLPEFTTGMLTAHFFMTIGDRGRAGVRAAYPLAGGIALIVAVYAGLRMDIPQGLKWWLMVTSTFSIPVAFGLIFISLASTKTLLSRFLGSRPVSAAGDATYSLYLFHLTAIQALALGATVPQSLSWFLAAGARYVVLFALLIPICLGVYKAYEAPLRMAIRRYLDTRSDGVAFVVILLFVGIPALFAAYGWLHQMN